MGLYLGYSIFSCCDMAYLHDTKVVMNHESMIFHNAGLIVLVLHSFW